MVMKEVYLMTKNIGKLSAAQSAFTPFGIEVKSLDFEIPEIQANTSIEIARDAVTKAYDKFKKPVIREDHSFFIDELGIPGPFMAYIDKNLSVENLVKIIKTLSSKKAHFELAAAYIDNSGNIHEFVYTVPVLLSTEPKGDMGRRWDTLMHFENDDKAFAEYDSDEKTDVWNRNYVEIAKLISREI